MNSIPGSLWEWLAPIEPDERLALTVTTIVVGLVALVFIVGIVSHSVGKIHRARLESALKRELLDRGMSSAEIAEIVEASAVPTGLRPIFQGRRCAQERKHVTA